MGNKSILFIAALLALAFTSCNDENMSNDVIAQNDDYTITGDSIIEGKYVASALSSTHIVSNYAPTNLDKKHRGLVKFRLAINGHDNELPTCQYHYAVAGKDATVQLGQPDTIPALNGSEDLKNNADNWRLNVDLSPMFESFKKNGWYATATGDTIFKNDFHGVWIAGNIPPMTWNFYTLESNARLRLHPSGKNGLYEIALPLQWQGEEITYHKEWQIKAPDRNYAVVNTGQNLIDALYNMSIQDIAACKEKTGRGQGYRPSTASQTSMSYPVILSLAYIDPQRAMETLKGLVKNGEIRHRATSSYGAWPIVANDMAWAAAAWEIYAVNGDKQWLNYAYHVIKKTIDRDYTVNCGKTNHLMRGGLQYAFSQSQFYPCWMKPKDIYETLSLTSNLLYERAFEILNDMGDELEVESDYGEKAIELKDAINETLWNERNGYYSQYTYIGAYPVQSPGIDNLGQALSVLWNVADDNRAETLIMKTPTTHFGIPAASPHYASVEEENLSETISPTIQALWNLASAKTGNEHMLRRGLGALYRAQALFCANTKGWDAYHGQAIDSSRGDLYCAAANVAMIFRIFAGMTFLPNGIEFNPVIPVFMKGTKRITGFKYRHAVIDIFITGTGNDIESISIDGQEGNDNFFPATLRGHHVVLINMRNNQSPLQEVTVGDKKFSLPNIPVVKWKNDSSTIINFNSNLDYRMVVNGKFRYNVNDTTFAHYSHGKGFSISAIIGIGKLSFSYLSKPFYNEPPGCRFLLAPHANARTKLPARSATRQPIEISNTRNRVITIPFLAQMSGKHFIDIHYANGNTAGGCPLLQVEANSHPQGTLVLPPIGQNEWHHMGMSNMLEIELLKGTNQITLTLVGQKSTKTVLADYVRIVKR